MHLNFLYVPVSWVLLRWHQLLSTAGLDPAAGLTWALSIVLLVVTARLLLVRLFIKQVHAQRTMQRLQPKIAAMRKKHRGDRAELNRQLLQLQQEEGVNPLAGFLPALVQIPVFLALYHVLRHVSNSVALCSAGPGNRLLTQYTFSAAETCSAAKAKLFGAPLAAYFRDGPAQLHLLGGDPASTRCVILTLLVISALAAFSTQLLARANSTGPAEGSAATVARIMLYVVPLGTLVSGLLFRFPLGVLLYWCTSNLWTLAQQAYLVRFHPRPPAAVSPEPVSSEPVSPGRVSPRADRPRGKSREHSSRPKT